MQALKVHLLGQFTVLLADESITRFRSVKSRLLLAYLASEPDVAHQRSTLATLLWGDLPESTAKTNLRIELSSLKKLLKSHPALQISRYEVVFSSADAWVDVVAFERGAGVTEGISAETLTTALDLYRGDFLRGISLAATPDIEDWQRLRQEQLHQQAMAALDWLQAHHTSNQNWPTLATTAQRQLALVPWHEPAYASLITALVAQGHDAEAHKQLDRCRAVLASELGVGPSSDLDALLTRSDRAADRAQPQHNLDAEITPIIGRGREIDTLIEWLGRERLVTVMGVGGVGKSSLAQAVARVVLPQFRDGVWFVPLAGIAATPQASEQIAQLLAETLAFKLKPTETASKQVVTALQERQMLLVLDNWEHLAYSAENILTTLLTQTPIHILTTSRQSVNIPDERRLVLEGLPILAATTLFVDRSQRRIPSDDLNNAEVAIAQICRLVEGLPLGIELAASQVAHFGIDEIAAQLAQNFAALANLDTAIDRHRSLKAAFDFSWALLSTRERTVLSELSVFRGSFDRAAALAVTDASVSELGALVNASLLRRATAGRYSLHEVIRVFSAESLTDSQSTECAYSRYYLNLAQALYAREQVGSFSEDVDNMRRAWLTAQEQRQGDLLQASVSGWTKLFVRNGLVRDTIEMVEAAITELDNWPVGDATQTLRAHLNFSLTGPYRNIGKRRAAIVAAEKAVALINDGELTVYALGSLITDHAELGEWELVDSYAVQQRRIARQIETPHLLAKALSVNAGANILHFRGDFAQSIAELESALALVEELPKQSNLKASILSSLSTACMRYRDLARAIRYAQRQVDDADSDLSPFAHVNALIGLGLAQQFAGLYEEAAANSLVALQLSKEMEDIVGSGLLHANLCLTYRQTGAFEAALTHGQAALRDFAKVVSPRMEGMARNRLGHTLLALERFEEAGEMYVSAETIFHNLEHSNRYESLAGQAAAAAQVDIPAQPQQTATTVLSYAQEHGLMGFVEPVNMMLQCISAFEAVNQSEQVAACIELAQGWIDLVAQRTSDAAIRDNFLTERVANRRLAVLASTLL